MERRWRPATRDSTGKGGVVIVIVFVSLFVMFSSLLTPSRTNYRLSCPLARSLLLSRPDAGWIGLGNPYRFGAFVQLVFVGCICVGIGVESNQTAVCEGVLFVCGFGCFECFSRSDPLSPPTTGWMNTCLGWWVDDKMEKIRWRDVISASPILEGGNYLQPTLLQHNSRTRPVG